jgi:valyl-tRNA synthetase
VWYVKGVEGVEEQYVVARSEESAYEKARSMYGDTVKLEQDPDVLDTWFSRLAASLVWDVTFTVNNFGQKAVVRQLCHSWLLS